MKNHFDMDEVFQLLRDDKTRVCTQYSPDDVIHLHLLSAFNGTVYHKPNVQQAIPHRPFASHPKHRSTFVFSLDYFTIIGDEW